MPTSVFISHAGADSLTAERVAQTLRAANARVQLDREILTPGDNFLSFMEQALNHSDYCLLLWSVAAATSRWVEAEWQSALHRTITESQRFLVVARLQDALLPRLLSPRLFLDLFPELEPGVSKLVALFRSDETARREGARDVRSPKVVLVEDPDGVTVYFSSALWDKTFPMRVNLKQPVAALVQKLVTGLGLPKQMDHDGRIGVRFSYELVHANRKLAPQSSLHAEGVPEHAFLWIETSMEPFAATAPSTGTMATLTFRSENATTQLLKLAREALVARAAVLGLKASG